MSGAARATLRLVGRIKPKPIHDMNTPTANLAQSNRAMPRAPFNPPAPARFASTPAAAPPRARGTSSNLAWTCICAASSPPFSPNSETDFPTLQFWPRDGALLGAAGGASGHPSLAGARAPGGLPQSGKTSWAYPPGGAVMLESDLVTGKARDTPRETAPCGRKEPSRKDRERKRLLMEETHE